jgi:hypothetical protein
MKRRPEAKSLNPEEIEFLQDCYNSLRQSLKFEPASEEGDAVARALILAYQRGIHDRANLLQLARY